MTGIGEPPLPGSSGSSESRFRREYLTEEKVWAQETIEKQGRRSLLGCVGVIICWIVLIAVQGVAASVFPASLVVLAILLLVLAVVRNKLDHLQLHRAIALAIRSHEWEKIQKDAAERRRAIASES